MNCELGNYKVAWVDKKDTNSLHSQMFDVELEAVDFINKNNFDKVLLMKLNEAKSGAYSWSIVPKVGDAQQYEYGMWVVRNWFFGLGIFLILYFVWKKITT